MNSILDLPRDALSHVIEHLADLDRARLSVACRAARAAVSSAGLASPASRDMYEACRQQRARPGDLAARVRVDELRALHRFACGETDDIGSAAREWGLSGGQYERAKNRYLARGWPEPIRIALSECASPIPQLGGHPGCAQDLFHDASRGFLTDANALGPLGCGSDVLGNPFVAVRVTHHHPAPRGAPAEAPVLLSRGAMMMKQRYIDSPGSWEVSATNFNDGLVLKPCHGYGTDFAGREVTTTDLFYGRQSPWCVQVRNLLRDGKLSVPAVGPFPELEVNIDARA